MTGCLAQRYHAEIPKEIPEVDAVIGTGAYDTLVEVIAGLLPEQEGGPLEEEMMAEGARLPDKTDGEGEPEKREPVKAEEKKSEEKKPEDKEKKD